MYFFLNFFLMQVRYAKFHILLAINFTLHLHARAGREVLTPILFAGHRAPSLQTAVLFLVLFCGPQRVFSDSDEEILTEWETWKSMYRISYDDQVRQMRSEACETTCALTEPDLH